MMTEGVYRIPGDVTALHGLRDAWDTDVTADVASLSPSAQLYRRIIEDAAAGTETPDAAVSEASSIFAIAVRAALRSFLAHDKRLDLFLWHHVIHRVLSNCTCPCCLNRLCRYPVTLACCWRVSQRVSMYFPAFQTIIVVCYREPALGLWSLGPPPAVVLSPQVFVGPPACCITTRRQ